MSIIKKYSSLWLSLAGFILICFLIEMLGGWLTGTSVLTWYPSLKKASFNPPPWVFGPVWTILYVIIAISGWLIFCTPKSKKRERALYIYGFQLVLNLLWSFFFFFLQSPFLGFLDIIALLVSIIWMAILFWPLSRGAFWLLLPYFFWTCYASILNGAILVLNLN
jgi:benzodiazapine receptor